MKSKMKHKYEERLPVKNIMKELQKLVLWRTLGNKAIYTLPFIVSSKH